jgi:hypothetical protein
VRSIFAVLGSFVVLTNLLEAQVSKPQSAGDREQPTNDTGTSVGLLQQSRDLDNLLPMPMRVVLLPRQAEMVSHLNPNLGREWANELFALALQVKAKLLARTLTIMSLAECFKCLLAACRLILYSPLCTCW